MSDKRKHAESQGNIKVVKKLTAKERIAVERFIETGSKIESYRSAYSTKGKDASLHRMAVQVFDRPHVASEVDRLQTEARERNRATVDEIVGEYRKMYMFDPADAVTAGPGFVQLKCRLEDMSLDVRRNIKSLTPTKWGTRIEFYDRKAAMDSVAKHLGMFSERHLLEMAGAGLNLNIYLDREEPPMTPAEISEIRVLAD